MTVFLLALVIVGRILAFPASIWEQDEAYLALGVQQFDLGLNHPHPPWFPLWLLLGKLVSYFGFEPARSLQLLSALLSSWMIFPLVALWSNLFGRRIAVSAALLFLFLPGSWLLAGRAFTGTAATALLIAALAMWIGGRPELSRARSFFGGILAAAAVLIRPHFLPVVGVVILILMVQRGIQLLPALASLVGGGLLGFAGLSVAAGGLSPLILALQRHSEYHFSRLSEAGLDLARFGLSRYLGDQWLAVFWMGLTVTGIVAAIRSGKVQRSSCLIICGALVATILEILTVANPAHARYFVPVAALSVGFVLFGISQLGIRWAVCAAFGGVLASVTVVAPELSAYRSEISPALAAVRHAVRSAQAEGSILVADRTLISFLDLVKSESDDFPPVIYGFQILDGSAPPPPPEYSIAVFDEGHGRFISAAPETKRFRCDSPIIRRIAQGRFLDVVVAMKPTLKGWKKQSKPYIILGN